MHIYNFGNHRRLVLATLLVAAGTLAASADQPAFYYQRLPALDDAGVQVADMTESGMIAASAGHQFGTTDRFEAICTNRHGGMEILTNGPLPTKYYAAAMNENGQVAGKRYVYQSQPVDASVFRYTPGVGVQNLGKLSGANGQIHDMNAAGTVVGGWQLAGAPEWHAFWTVGSQVVALPELGAVASEAYDINDNGTIVGAIVMSDTQRHPVRWQNGQAQMLASFDGAAVACNNAGTILLQDNSAFGGAWLQMANGSSLPLFCFGAPALTGVALSESGYAIGTWVDGDSHTRGYRFNANTFEMLDLGVVPGYELGMLPQVVNDRGEVAGMAVNSDYEITLFFWSPEGGMVDLGALQPDADEWRMNAVVALNNAGQILVTGALLPSFSNTDAGAVFWPRRPGDLNNDRVVNFRDIDPFVAALAGQAAYYNTHPLGEWLNADVNGDGLVNFADINPLVGLLGR